MGTSDNPFIAGDTVSIERGAGTGSAATVSQDDTGARAHPDRQTGVRRRLARLRTRKSLTQER